MRVTDFFFLSVCSSWKSLVLIASVFVVTDTMADQYASRLDNLESLVNEMKIQSDETATRTKEIHMFMQILMGDQDKDKCWSRLQ